MNLKSNRLSTAKELKQLASNVREIAKELESNENLQCLECKKIKVEKSVDEYGVVNVEVNIRLSLFEQADIDQVGIILEGR